MGEARRVICAPKEVVEVFQEEMDAEARERLFEEFNTLSTVFRQPASKFVLSKEPIVICKMQPPVLPDDQQYGGNDQAGDANGYTVSAATTLASNPQPQPNAGSDLLVTWTQGHHKLSKKSICWVCSDR